MESTIMTSILHGELLKLIFLNGDGELKNIEFYAILYGIDELRFRFVCGTLKDSDEYCTLRLSDINSVEIIAGYPYYKIPNKPTLHKNTEIISQHQSFNQQ